MDDNSICEAFSKALDLELEGISFYEGCAKHTDNEDGKKMFLHLAGEEKTHYKNVAEIFSNLYHDRFCKYEQLHQDNEDSGVFEEKVPGGNLNEASDALDALNIAVNAEDNSIKLYETLAENVADQDSKVFFTKMVDEEKNHKSILESEAQFVTETGEFKDFTQVTM